MLFKWMKVINNDIKEIKHEINETKQLLFEYIDYDLEYKKRPKPDTGTEKRKF